MQLAEAQRNSFLAKYNLITAQDIKLTRENCRDIFESNFSLSEEEGNHVIEKAFEISENKDELDRDGFFMGLKCIQAIQNDVDISSTSTQKIYDTLYVQKLKVRRKADQKDNMVYMENTLIFDPGFKGNYDEMNQFPTNLSEAGINNGESFYERVSQQKQNDDDQNDFQIIGSPQQNDEEKSQNRDIYQSVKIINVKQGKEGLIWYQIETVHQNRSTLVARRFNDFEMLNTYILRKYQGEIFPKLPQKESIYAYYNWIMGDKEAFIKRRKILLQEYLNKILDLKLVAIDQDEIVRNFLVNDDLFVNILQKAKTQVKACSILSVPIQGPQIIFDDDNDDPIPDPLSFNITARLQNLLVKHQSLDQWILYIKDYKGTGNKFSFEYEATLNSLAELKKRYSDLQQVQSNLTNYQQNPDYHPYQADLSRRAIVHQTHFDQLNNVGKRVKKFNFDQAQQLIKDKLLRLEDIFHTINEWRRIINQWAVEKKRLDADKTNNPDMVLSRQRNIQHEEKITRNLATLNLNIDQENRDMVVFQEKVIVSLLKSFKQ